MNYIRIFIYKINTYLYWQKYEYTTDMGSAIHKMTTCSLEGSGTHTDSFRQAGCGGGALPSPLKMLSALHTITTSFSLFMV